MNRAIILSEHYDEATKTTFRLQTSSEFKRIYYLARKTEDGAEILLDITADISAWLCHALPIAHGLVHNHQDLEG